MFKYFYILTFLNFTKSIVYNGTCKELLYHSKIFTNYYNVTAEYDFFAEDHRYGIEVYLGCDILGSLVTKKHKYTTLNLYQNNHRAYDYFIEVIPYNTDKNCSYNISQPILHSEGNITCNGLIPISYDYFCSDDSFMILYLVIGCLGVLCFGLITSFIIYIYRKRKITKRQNTLKDQLLNTDYTRPL